MNRIAIVTALSGRRDKLSKPSVVFPNADYIAFVEKRWDVPVWDQRKLCCFSRIDGYMDRRNAKVPKIIPHLMAPGYEYYIWVDTTHDVIKDPDVIVGEFLKDSNIAVFRHRERRCAYQELLTVLQIRYDHDHLLRNQFKDYKEANFPEDYGLFELPGFIRRNTPSMEQFNMRWWEQICRYSSRDQISFPFVAWSFNTAVSIIPGETNGALRNNGYITATRRHGQ